MGLLLVSMVLLFLLTGNVNGFQCQDPNKYMCWDLFTCIPDAQLCDGGYNCQYTFDDEFFCDKNASKTCKTNGQYECMFSKQCIEYTKFCDGENDCALEDDEILCDPDINICGPGKIHCPTDYETCFDASKLCDGVVDCAEWDETIICHFKLKEDGKCISYSKGHIPCGDQNNTCIPAEKKCDGIWQCPNGNDEPDSCKTEHQCYKNFYCHKSDTCISFNLECDLIADCPGGEDEWPENKKCSCEGSNQFRCFGGKCIGMDQVCNKNDTDGCFFLDDESANACFLKANPTTSTSTTTTVSTTTPTSTPTTTTSTTNTPTTTTESTTTTEPTTTTTATTTSESTIIPKTESTTTTQPNTNTGSNGMDSSTTSTTFKLTTGLWLSVISTVFILFV